MITGPFAPFWSTEGQGALLLPAFLALFLSALIGVEREVRAKSAGLRTHTLVGLGSAVFMLVSKYGFGDLVDQAGVSVDPSRIAAQVVSGIGFIGGGLIFVRRDIVRGLTTAATVWLAAAVGMAAGAGLPLLAVGTTVGHFIISTGSRRWCAIWCGAAPRYRCPAWATSTARACAPCSRPAPSRAGRCPARRSTGRSRPTRATAWRA